MPPNRLDSEHVLGLFNCLRHRGPDDQGYLLFSSDGAEVGRTWPYRNEVAGVVLVHRRLSILDLSENGWQPMASVDGRYYIVFNGEIYNYLELRQELHALGYQFRSSSDTEVLLAAYAHWGSQALVRLMGMFSFAILDTCVRRLILARDVFGIKPLYYASGSDGFAFASEVEALLGLPGVGRSVNPHRLYSYLRHGLTDHGSETLFADIRQLPAAHYLEVPLDAPWPARPICYWQVDLSQRSQLSFEQAAERLRELFLESVRLHLRSDVPVGVTLSGGIDSSSIVTAMRYLQGKNLELHSFSYVPDDPAISEEKWVDLVGGAAGAIKHKVRISAGELLADLQRLVKVQGEPFGSTNIYAQYRVFKLASEFGIKVMLGGQGADELLGGYRFFIAARLASLLRQGRWVEAGRFLLKASQWSGTSMSWLLFITADFFAPHWVQAPARQWIGKDFSPPWLNMSWFIERGVVPRSLCKTNSKAVLRAHLFRTLSETSLPHLLRYEDRNSMAFSIESRVPFLTPELANFVLSLPEEYIVSSGGVSKAVFRRAMRGIVPEVILSRKDKIGFTTQELDWLTALRLRVDSTFKDGMKTLACVLNAEEVKRDWEAVLQGRRPFDWGIWRWLNLIEWTRLFGVRYE